MDDDRIFEHQIKIDDNTDIRLRIPEVIDAIEFTSILEKARKILKISEIQIFSSSHKRLNIDEEKLINEYQNAVFSQRQQLVSKYNFKNYQALQSKIYLIRKKLDKSVNKNSAGRKKKYSDELFSDVIKRIQAGESVPNIANNLQMSKKVLYKLISKRTGKSLREIKTEKSNHGNTGKGRIWTEENIMKLKQLYSEETKTKDIADKLGMKTKQVSDKMTTMKRDGQLKSRDM